MTQKEQLDTLSERDRKEIIDLCKLLNGKTVIYKSGDFEAEAVILAQPEIHDLISVKPLDEPSVLFEKFKKAGWATTLEEINNPTFCFCIFRIVGDYNHYNITASQMERIRRLSELRDGEPLIFKNIAGRGGPFRFQPVCPF